MIAKMAKGGGFRGALEYDLEEGFVVVALDKLRIAEMERLSDNTHRMVGDMF